RQEEGHSLPVIPGNPIYQIILYGRTIGQQRPDWIKQIRIKSPQQATKGARASTTARSETATDTALLVSNEILARSGSPEAIARYLSETLSPLGVSVKVLIQNLPDASAQPEEQEKAASSSPNRRLWVVCNSNYSPDASLIAEPVVEQLRHLQLKGFRDAAICSQVSGEATPEWMLRVDLTPPEEMLKEWAHWGDVQAIARTLNQRLKALGMEVRAVLKDATVHLFCSLLKSKGAVAPDKQQAMRTLVPILERIAPQGIQSAMVYGVETCHDTAFQQRLLAPEPEAPAWIEWLNLPAAFQPHLAESAYSLAQKGSQDAITFLLHRLLNPDLDRRLATGGIHLKIRRKQDLLHIMSEAPICPPQAQVGPPIAKFLRQLAIPEIAGVRVYGRRAGSTAPVWNYGDDFVHRRRLVPEATPEFAASDAYVNDLVAPTEEPALRPDLTKEDLKDGLRQTLQATVRTLRRGLCYSQIFVPLENQDRAAIPQRSSSSSFSASLGFKVALVWGTLGLLLTIQTDWLVGQLLRSPKPSSDVKITESSPTTMPLPKLSLQKGGKSGTEDFNASGFTRTGETSVIINERTESPEKASAATAAVLAAARSPNPSFNNPLLDEKIVLYQQRLLQNGPPDVLIVGSSRALRGVDPVALQDALAREGYPDIEVFNFGINGATAQVVDFLIREVLAPEQLPKLIIWADGARAFNSGREDATYKAIATSEGYQHLKAGTFPSLVEVGKGDRKNRSSEGINGEAANPIASWKASYQSINDWLNQSLGKLSSTYLQRDELKSVLREQYVSLMKQTNVSSDQTLSNTQKEVSNTESIDFDGFLPLSVRFSPATYYQNHARVAGDYDSDYQSFQLAGEQDAALEALLQFAKAQDIGVVFVNLPLTKDYLDPTRTAYEEQFQKYMRTSALQRGLIFRDLSQLLPTKHDYFSDPSHLNRYGAYQVAKQLAQDPLIPWSVKPTKD
ncbi:MAG: DUF1574 domain-containing protein, partial [Microcoleus sp. SIO2G3]|nr:DUF1574 domain-containing protein [Microcoleus sp. SIO2G3]